MNKWYQLGWISLAQFFSLSLWFSATAILPSLKEIWNLRPSMEPWVTSSVQIGFIVGALLNAFFGFADRFNGRKLFIYASLLGSFVNVLLIFVHDPMVGLFIRMITGAMLAGVYPTAVKMVAQWFPKQKGLAMGVVIGALTLGSALPHFFVAFFPLNWRWVLLSSSVLALLSSVIMSVFVKDTPQQQYNGTVSFDLLKRVLKNKPVTLANYGYFGHMWELYAMWTWFPVFLLARSTTMESALWMNAVITFVSIGLGGAVGCIAGGVLADRIGRARLTIISMGISSACCIVIGFSFYLSNVVLVIIAFIWGMSVIADSAQFSAAVTEFSEKEYVGTALAFQMAVGFFITIVSINLIGFIEKYVGWEWAFAFLSVGPLVGILAMAKLRTYELLK